MKAKLFIHFTYLVKKVSDCMDLLLIFDEKSHIMCILTGLCSIKKKYIFRCCLQCFSSQKVLTEHKENCLIIKGKANCKVTKRFD